MLSLYGYPPLFNLYDTLSVLKILFLHNLYNFQEFEFIKLHTLTLMWCLLSFQAILNFLYRHRLYFILVKRNVRHHPIK